MKKTIIFCLVLLLIFTADAAEQKQTKSLHEAARDGDIAQVQSHFLRGANVDEIKNGFTPLHLAASGGHKGVTEMLIASGAKINTNTRKDRSTPLHLAATGGHKDVVELLIDKGANIHATQNSGLTPLHGAVLMGHGTVAQLLIEKGADINAKDKKQNTLLHLAAERKYKNVAEFLIAKGADINAKQEHGRTPLHLAGSSQVAEVLIEKGADINAKDNFGQTALHLAARSGRKDVAEILLDKRADINAKDRLNLTALHCAALGGHKAVGELLIVKNADVSAKQIGDITPLHLAARSGHKAMVELLAEKKADVNAKHSDGWTPLHEAAVGGHRDVAEVLIAKGANINAKDKTGWTPLRRAKEQGHTQVVELLLKHGAIGDASIQIADKVLSSAEEEKQAPKQIIDISSIANIDPLDDPNAAKARIKIFQGLEEALESVAKQSDNEIKGWINGLEGITTDIVKAVYEQVGAEFEFVRKQAAEETADKTTAALDGVLLSRMERFDRIVEKIQDDTIRREERESRRPGRSSRSTRGRTGDMNRTGTRRDSGYNSRRRYPDTGRQDSRRRSRDDMTSRPSIQKVTIKNPFKDPNTVKAALKTFEGLEKELKNIERMGLRETRGWTRSQAVSSSILAKAVYQQVEAELKFNRKIAVEEKAAKTTVAIDGMLVSRQERFGRLVRIMLEERRNLRRVERRPGSRIGTRR